MTKEEFIVFMSENNVPSDAEIKFKLETLQFGTLVGLIGNPEYDKESNSIIFK